MATGPSGGSPLDPARLARGAPREETLGAQPLAVARSSGDLSLGLVDSHCHVQNLKPDERERALDEARERGVTGFLLPAVRMEDAEEILAFCHRHTDVWCALGQHPHEAGSWREGDRDRLRALLADPKAVAVGECGLDFFYDHAPREVQERCLAEQWSLAIELGLPAVVHNRDSNEAMLEMVRRPEHAGLRADFHSFAGSLEMCRELVERGFYFGFSGMITFAKADNIRQLVPEVPRDRQLVETDTPYLAPAPHRGKPNKPAWVVEIAQRLAQECGETYEQTCRRTGEAFARLFRRVGT